VSSWANTVALCWVAIRVTGQDILFVKRDTQCRWPVAALTFCLPHSLAYSSNAESAGFSETSLPACTAHVPLDFLNVHGRDDLATCR